jgi:hypothetical protein
MKITSLTTYKVYSWVAATDRATWSRTSNRSCTSGVAAR